VSTAETLTLEIGACSVTAHSKTDENMAAAKKINLEKSLADLEELVEELESGDLPLETAMKKFEEGIKLTRGCQTALKEAEQKVEILLESAGGESLGNFEVEDP
jgi:exodeoxyribonuclease VII small subunit